MSDQYGSMGKVCGNTAGVFESETNVMYVTFHADSSINGNSFNLEYNTDGGKN